MQETGRAEEFYTNTDSISKSDIKDKPMVINKLSNTIDYFLPGPNCNSDNRVSAEITQQSQRDLEHVYNGTGGFDSTFSLQLKPDTKPCQASLRHVAYTLQKALKEELNDYKTRHHSITRH